MIFGEVLDKNSNLSNVDPESSRGSAVAWREVGLKAGSAGWDRGDTGATN